MTTTPDTTPTQFTIVGAVDGWLAHPDTGHDMAQAWDDDRNAPQAWGEALWFSAQIWAECSLAIGVRRVEAEFLSEAKARIAGMGADLAAAEARHTAALEAASSPAEFDQAYGIRRTVADYLRHTMTTTDHAAAIAVEDSSDSLGSLGSGSTESSLNPTNPPPARVLGADLPPPEQLPLRRGGFLARLFRRAASTSPEFCGRPTASGTPCRQRRPAKIGDTCPAGHKRIA